MSQPRPTARFRRRRPIAVGVTTVLASAALIASSAPALAATAPATIPSVPTSAVVPDFPITSIGPERNPNLPDVVVIDAGGTLTSRARDRISYLHYSGSVDGGVQTILEDMYPELAGVANIQVVQVGGLGGSSGVRNSTLYNVSRTADAQLAREEVDGVVITAGTNVLEEDAYFFDLTVQSDKPVVVTGSMHQYGTFTYDAYTNLFSSVRVAASGETTCYGTVVLLNDQFFAARDVTKTDGYRMDTFEAAVYGPLGVVNEDNIRTMRAPSRVMACGTDTWKTPFNLATIRADQLPLVDIVYGYVEASAGTITGPVAAGARGIVTAGHGPGGLSYLQTPARRDAIAQGVLFVSTTRTGGEGTYDSGSTGNIGAADMLPQKARLLLQMGLAFSNDQEQIRGWFNTIGLAEFPTAERAQSEPAPEPEPSSSVEPSEQPTEQPAESPAPTESVAPQPSQTPAATAVVGGGGGSNAGGLALTGGLGVGAASIAAALLLGGGATLYLRNRRKRLGEQILTH